MVELRAELANVITTVFVTGTFVIAEAVVGVTSAVAFAGAREAAASTQTDEAIAALAATAIAAVVAAFGFGAVGLALNALVILVAEQVVSAFAALPTAAISATIFAGAVWYTTLAQLTGFAFAASAVLGAGGASFRVFLRTGAVAAVGDAIRPTAIDDAILNTEFVPLEVAAESVGFADARFALTSAAAGRLCVDFAVRFSL